MSIFSGFRWLLMGRPSCEGRKIGAKSGPGKAPPAALLQGSRDTTDVVAAAQADAWPLGRTSMWMPFISGVAAGVDEAAIAVSAGILTRGLTGGFTGVFAAPFATGLALVSTFDLAFGLAFALTTVLASALTLAFRVLASFSASFCALRSAFFASLAFKRTRSSRASARFFLRFFSQASHLQPIGFR